MSEHPPVFEHGSTCVAYADVLVLEQHGPVTHLLHLGGRSEQSKFVQSLATIVSQSLSVLTLSVKPYTKRKAVFSVTLWNEAIAFTFLVYS